MIDYADMRDNELVRLLKTSDQAAFAAIYNKHWYPLLSRVIRTVHIQPEAEDIVQELFTSIWKRRHDLEISCELSTYLHTSARYMAIRYVEKNITRSNYLRTLSVHFEGAGVPTPEVLFCLHEMEENIDRAIGSLPRKMGEVFMLSRKRHLSYKEISEQLNISEQTVKKQIYNAHKLLKEEVGYMPFVLLVFLLSAVAIVLSRNA